MPTADLNGHGTRIFFESIGTGSPLVFISGVGLDHMMWAKQVEEFAPDYRCILFDNPGTGRSTLPKPTCSIGDFGVQLWELLDALGIGRAHLCGFSMGGMIALEAASIEPERVMSLSLHSTAGRSFAAFTLLFESLKHALDRDDGRSWARLSTLFAHPAAKLAADETLVGHEIEERMARFEKMSSAQKNGLKIQYQALIDYRVGASLDRIKCPCLITAGTEDVITPSIYSEWLAQDIKQATMVYFQGVAHRTPALAHREFNEELRSFLHNCAALPVQSCANDEQHIAQNDHGLSHL